MRRYESGSTWAFWRWTDVDWQGATYLLRLHLIKTPWFAIMLHWILSPDPAPDPHDHPVDFVSLTLRGGYTEFRPFPPPARRGSGLANDRRLRITRATDVHRILFVTPGTLTLVVCGPSKRRWGYHTREGWVDWKNYRDAHAR